jgi:hypothetical protein
MTKETTELSKIDSVKELSTNFYSSPQLFEHAQRVAKVFSQSDMVPDRYKNNIGNCIIALEMANRMGASPLMVMQNLDIIKGKPGWSSKFLIATLNASGKFSPLRYESDDKEGGRTRAVAIDKMTNEKCVGAWVSMTMAKAEGWIDKAGSKWKTMPGLMIQYRAASFFTNQFAPEVSMGLRTVEDIYDTEFIDVTPKKEVTDADKERDRLIQFINTCTKKDELESISTHIPADDAELSNLYDEKLKSFVKK